MSRQAVSSDKQERITQAVSVVHHLLILPVTPEWRNVWDSLHQRIQLTNEEHCFGNKWSTIAVKAQPNSRASASPPASLKLIDVARDIRCSDWVIHGEFSATADQV